MLLIINRKAYGDLLAEIQPHVITNDADNEIALQNMERLLALPQPTAEEERILQLLLTLIEKYEEEHYPIDAPDPIEAIKFRMEQMGYNQTDLAKIVGFKSRASEILNKKRKLSLEMIRQLHDSLNIPTDVLIQAY